MHSMHAACCCVYYYVLWVQAQAAHAHMRHHAITPLTPAIGIIMWDQLHAQVAAGCPGICPRCDVGAVGAAPDVVGGVGAAAPDVVGGIVGAVEHEVGMAMPSELSRNCMHAHRAQHALLCTVALMRSTPALHALHARIFIGIEAAPPSLSRRHQHACAAAASTSHFVTC